MLAVVVSAVIAFVYFAMIAAFTRGLRRVTQMPKCDTPPNSVSIIVPFHNEESTIGQMIESVLAQRTETRFELIAVDDHSSDKSAQIVSTIAQTDSRLHLTTSTQRGKKNALLCGIEQAQSDTIIITDADCTYPPTWINTMTSAFAGECMLLAAPVRIAGINSLFNKFQFVDFASLVGSGMGAAGCRHPIMCNAANLMFSKSAFERLNNPLNNSYASGDDVFLLHKFKQAYGDKIRFVFSADATAETKPATSISHFMRQRMRWGGKTPGYTDRDAIAVAFVVAVTNIVLCADVAIAWWCWVPAALVYSIKLLIDSIFLKRVCNILGNNRWLWMMPVFEVAVALYTTIVVIGIGIRRNPKPEWH